MNWENAKGIIVVSCIMLNMARKNAPSFSQALLETSSDGLVLLEDATKILCQAVSEFYKENVAKRWTPELPEFLYTHPERCAEVLAIIEQKDFREVCFLKCSELNDRHD